MPRRANNSALGSNMNVARIPNDVRRNLIEIMRYASVTFSHGNLIEYDRALLALFVYLESSFRSLKSCDVEKLTKLAAEIAETSGDGERLIISIRHALIDRAVEQGLSNNHSYELDSPIHVVCHDSVSVLFTADVTVLEIKNLFNINQSTRALKKVLPLGEHYESLSHFALELKLNKAVAHKIDIAQKIGVVLGLTKSFAEKNIPSSVKSFSARHYSSGASIARIPWTVVEEEHG